MTSSNSSITISNCRVCQGPNLNEFLDLGLQPLANELRSNPKDTNNAFPLILTRCADCGTIQLTETVDPELLFSNYVWVTGTSKTAHEYSLTFCDSVLKRFDCPPNQLKVVEIASNDGTFLSRFKDKGCNVLGIDPAQNIAKVANDNGINTLPEFFGSKLASQIAGQDGHCDFIFARNVIPHVADVYDVISGINILLKQDGLGAIEFHRADKILDELHYDSVYHEHVCYHSISSLSFILNKFDLNIFDVHESPISGGSYVIYFSKLNIPQSFSLKSALENELSLNIMREESWLHFADSSRSNRDALNLIVNQMLDEGKTIIGYGASARSSTVLNFCNITSSQLSFIVDKSDYKHSKYSPGVGIPIVSPQYFVERSSDIDSIIILAWNFKDEIINWLISIEWHGQVVLPLPNKPYILDI